MKICLVCEGITDTEQPTCSSCGLRLVKTSEVHFPLRRGEEDAANPLLGTLIDGKYRITNVLGRGGMGTVFRAVHEVSLVPVALKILHPRFAALPVYRDHFLAEARKAGRVVHEHSSRVLDVGEDNDGTVYIAMELVEGVTLADWIHGGERMSPADVALVMQQICEALTIAHDEGLVHRDLSPRNVMGLVRDGLPFVKILDFGISKGTPAPRSEAEVVSEPVDFVTPPYSAPEHLIGEEVDARADLYSLGVIAYEALTGALPVRGKTKHELARATVDGDLVPLRAPAGTPRRLKRLIKRLLARDPALRPASAREVCRELDRILHPRTQGLRVAAVVSLLLSLPAFLVTHADRTAPYVELAGARKKPTLHRNQTERLEEIRSAELDLVLRYGGFNPRALRVETTRPEVRFDAGSEVVVDPRFGDLRLSQERSPRYRAFVGELAASPDPVHLFFRVSDEPTLAYAHVLVDDDPPDFVLHGEHGGGDGADGGGVLNESSLLHLEVRDKGTIEELLVHIASGARTESVALDREELAIRSRAGELLGGIGDPWARRENVVLRVQATDRAGNRSELVEWHRFAEMDLRAPGIEAVRAWPPGISETITYSRAEETGEHLANVEVKMDAFEPGLTLVARDPDGREWTSEFKGKKGPDQTGVAVLRAPADAPDPPFVSGEWSFHVIDAAGNRGRELRSRLEFRSADLDIRLRRVEGDGGFSAIGDAPIATDGSPVVLQLDCNPLYAVARAALKGAPPEARELQARERQPGSYGLELPSLPDGDYTLELQLHSDARLLAPGTKSYLVRVLGRPIEIALPDTSNLRYLQQLLDANVLRRNRPEENERIGPGGEWDAVPSDRIQGFVWFGGSPDTLHAQEVAPGDSERLFDCHLLQGENFLVLELSDLLGRPVGVTIGGGPAPRIELPSGRLGAQVAHFWYRSSKPEPVAQEIYVEYGRPVSVVLGSPLPFGPGDELLLKVGDQTIGVTHVEPQEDRAQLTFEIPYDVVRRAWGDYTLQQLAAGPKREITVELLTPAGRYLSIVLTLKGTRSKLKPVSWEECAGAERAKQIDRCLRSIVMVPVPRPDDGRFDDGMSVLGPAETEFRPLPMPQVRDVKDVFLQYGELTRAQYEALVQAAAGLPLADRQKYIHPWDRLHGERFSNLTPQIFIASTETPEEAKQEWLRVLRAGEDRPVTGVSFFQAYTVSRIAGFVLFGDPETFRLPMGLEMELAALGSGAQRRHTRHGCEKLTIGKFRGVSAARAARAWAEWPLTAKQEAEAGDYVVVRGGSHSDARIVGLDFGVREWVLDLPYQESNPYKSIIREWLADHSKHVLHAMAAEEVNEQETEQIMLELRRNGVVRGAALGDELALVDNGKRVSRSEPESSPLPPAVPGVVRVLILPREGKTLDQPSEYLKEIGFRLVGAERFVRRMREGLP